MYSMNSKGYPHDQHQAKSEEEADFDEVVAKGPQIAVRDTGR